jgi:predicted TIM-barrel enzyme
MITPVIHVIDYDQVQMNVETCLETGIDHVFIIDHGSRNSPAWLATVREHLKADYPELWVGINFLFLPNHLAIPTGEVCGANAVWCDTAGLVRPGDEENAKQLHGIRVQKEMLYFGGIEFKYQPTPHPYDYEWLYENAMKYVDVITTSGPGTGKQIRLDKLIRIRETVGKHPIAVASGIDENNAKEISKYADYLMVASSITEPQAELIVKGKLQRLIDQCSK